MTNLNPLFSGILIEGKDACKFLHGFCTSSTENLQKGDGLKTLFCNGKGRILASALLFCLDKHKLVLMSEQQTREKLFAHLHRYKLLSQVVLTLTTDYTISIKKQIKEGHQAIRLDHQYWASLSLCTSEKKTYHQDMMELLDLLITLHYPLIHEQTSEDFTPHQLGLEQHDWIDFNKGCYLGQEIITRMHHLGKAKQAMQIRKLSTKTQDLLTPGQTCHNDEGKAVGNILYGSNQYALTCLNLSTLENHVFIDDDRVLLPR